MAALYPTVARNPPTEGGALPAGGPTGAGGTGSSAGGAPPPPSSAAALFPVLCVRVAPRLALTPGVLLPHEAGGHEVPTAAFDFDDSVERKILEAAGVPVPNSTAEGAAAAAGETGPAPPVAPPPPPLPDPWRPLAERVVGGGEASASRAEAYLAAAVLGVEREAPAQFDDVVRSVRSLTAMGFPRAHAAGALAASANGNGGGGRKGVPDLAAATDLCLAAAAAAGLPSGGRKAR